MRISAVLIVQDESQLLPRCLDSIKGVDEIIICDQGSEDNTIRIAQRYTDKIYTDHKWEDSFCKARNHAKSKATGDWILSIDADEWCHDFSEVRKAAEEADKQGYNAVECKMIAEDNGQFFMYPRLFKNVPEVFWVGNIHNHLSVQGVSIGNVQITHGYSPAHNRDPHRALRILEKDAKIPGNVREQYYLGREYFYRGRWEEAAKILFVYTEQTRYLSEKADAYLIMSRCFWNMRMADEARDACMQALLINANFKEAILWMADLSWPHNADQWKRMAETANNRDVLFVREIK